MSLRCEDWPRAREAFERALEMPASERGPYVAADRGRLELGRSAEKVNAWSCRSRERSID